MENQICCGKINYRCEDQVRLSNGVEWAAHAAILMVGLPDGHGIRAERLAVYLGVPPAYLAKQLQAMRRADLVISSRGAQGGYRLTKSASDISLWDITAAIEGPASIFRCTEVRQNGPCGLDAKDCRTACGIAAAFRHAEKTFRKELASVSLAALATQMLTDVKPDHIKNSLEWLYAESLPMPQTALEKVRD